MIYELNSVATACLQIQSTMTFHDKDARLDAACGMDRLHLLNTLAQMLVPHDRTLACNTARDAYELSLELEPQLARDVVLHARAAALFILELSPEYTENAAGRAYQLLSEHPGTKSARVLLQAGQMFQRMCEYRHAMLCFHHADLMLGGQSTQQFGAPAHN